MSYTKPQIVAKSAAKKSYVAGCPANVKGPSWTVKGGVRINNNCSKCELNGR